MNQKIIAFLKLGLISLLIAIALLNLALANWLVGIVILSVAMLALRNELELKRMKEEQAMLQEEFLQQDVLQRMRLLDELMRRPLSEPPLSLSHPMHSIYCDPSYICRGCKYFHGRGGVVCAVHPEGCVDNQCGDFEAKNPQS